MQAVMVVPTASQLNDLSALAAIVDLLSEPSARKMLDEMKEAANQAKTFRDEGNKALSDAEAKETAVKAVADANDALVVKLNAQQIKNESDGHANDLRAKDLEEAEKDLQRRKDEFAVAAKKRVDEIEASAVAVEEREKEAKDLWEKATAMKDDYMAKSGAMVAVLTAAPAAE